MKKFIRFISYTLLCVILISTSTVFISAASIDKVENVAVSSVGSNKVVLTWDEVDDVTGYKIYRYNKYFDRYFCVGRTRQLRFTDRIVASSSTYDYKVRGYKSNIAADSYGPFSDIVSGTTTPSRVRNLTVDYLSDSSANISWAACRGAAGYTVYVYDKNADDYVSHATTQANTYTFTNLTSGTEYSVKVAAYHEISGVSYGYKSKAISFTTAISEETSAYINAPQNFTATTDNVVVNLSWDKNTSATGYEIYRYNRVDNVWNLLTVTTEASCVDNSVSGTDIFTYRARAYVEENGKRNYSEYTDEVSVHYETIITNESIYNQELTENGILGYLYDPAEKCFYTSSDPWQRVAGYNSLYDTFAPMSLISFDTVRLRFDYADKNWMIQIWKGQYGAVFYGAEIGVYTKPKDRQLMHYDCASKEDHLKMSMDFYEYKNRLIGKDEWVRQFSRPYDSYWWCTGFIPGNKLGNYSNLRVDARITMKDYDMLSAFKKALEENSIPYTVSGLNVYLSYH